MAILMRIHVDLDPKHWLWFRVRVKLDLDLTLQQGEVEKQISMIRVPEKDSTAIFFHESLLNFLEKSKVRDPYLH